MEKMPGNKNAVTVAQNAYTNALHTLLEVRSFDHIANFADDFLGGENTIKSLPLTALRAFPEDV